MIPLILRKNTFHRLSLTLYYFNGHPQNSYSHLLLWGGNTIINNSGLPLYSPYFYSIILHHCLILESLCLERKNYFFSWKYGFHYKNMHFGKTLITLGLEIKPQKSLYSFNSL